MSSTVLSPLTGASPSSISSSSTGSGATRVLVVGDCGVGKSLLLKLLSSLLNTGRAVTPDDHLVATVGFNVEVGVWKRSNSVRTDFTASNVVGSGNHTQRKVVEFLEIGGNRNFFQTCCKPVLAAAGINGIIFMYDSQSSMSAASIMHWFREVSEVVDASTAIMLIGTVLTAGGETAVDSGDSFTSAVKTADASFMHSTWRSMKWMTRIINDPQQVYLAVARDTPLVYSSDGRQFQHWWRRCFLSIVRMIVSIERAFLFLCSCILFGFGQSIVPSWKQPSIEKSLAVVSNHSKCVAVVSGLPLSAISGGGEFDDAVEDVLRFLSLV